MPSTGVQQLLPVTANVTYVIEDALQLVHLKDEVVGEDDGLVGSVPSRLLLSVVVVTKRRRLQLKQGLNFDARFGTATFIRLAYLRQPSLTYCSSIS